MFEWSNHKLNHAIISFVNVLASVKKGVEYLIHENNFALLKRFIQVNIFYYSKILFIFFFKNFIRN